MIDLEDMLATACIVYNLQFAYNIDCRRWRYSAKTRGIRRQILPHQRVHPTGNHCYVPLRNGLQSKVISRVQTRA